MNQGRQANFTGKNLENQIKERLISSGYKEVKNNNYFHKTKFFGSDSIFATHCFIGRSIYDTKLYTDIILYDHEKHANNLAIEVKWQERSGSVDEKYPYLVTNIKKKFPCSAIIILDGGGYKQGSLNWLKEQVDDKLVGVFGIVDFLKWANGGGI